MCRIAERTGLTAIVKARPIEQSCRPGALGIELPAALDDVLIVLFHGAVQAHHSAGKFFIFEIPASRAAAGGFFRAHNLPRGILLFAVIHIVLHDIVEPYHIESLDHLPATCVGHRGMARRVE